MSNVYSQATDDIVGPTAQAERPRRGRLSLFVLVVLLIAFGAAAGYAVPLDSPFDVSSDASGAAAVVDPTSRATVAMRTLSARSQVTGTLGYAESYVVVNQAPGTIVALPDIGDVVERGERLYEVDGAPVALLYGATPAYRALALNMVGPDVAQLNANLVALGFSTSTALADSDVFGPETAAALTAFKAGLGYPEPDEEGASLGFGEAVFLPSAARVTSIATTLGATAQRGSTVLRATSTTRQVVVNLSASQQAAVAVGDEVAVTLADNTVTPGSVASVGRVATASPGSAPTITVLVRLDDPSAAGTLDQAPVLVSITTASVAEALVVPVTALLAQVGGGYAIEVADPDGTHRLVTVSLGLFDSSNGLVQVEGPDVRSGQQVVVPGL